MGSSESKSISVGEYGVQSLKILGKGAFGIFYQVEEKGHSKKKFAVKCITYQENEHFNEYLYEMVQNEIKICEQLKGHKNIFQLIDHINDGERHWLVRELCKLGDLTVYLKNHPNDLRRKLKIMKEIA